MSANRRPPRKPTAHQRRAQRRQAAAAQLRGSGRGTQARGNRPLRPLPKGDTFLTPTSNRWRRAVERRSAPLLVVLHQLPRWVLPLAMVVLFGIGFFAGGVGGTLCLGVLFIFVAWLSYLSWPAVSLPARLIRIALLGMIAALAVAQLS
ncbi:MAG: DUF6703 family protein [Streptomycetales bacterium]